METRRLAFTFHLGLLPAPVVLLGGRVDQLPFLLPVGISHILLLWAIGRRLPVPLDRVAIQTLHKAGFLHTLLGLAAATMTLAGAWGAGDPAGAPAAAILAPPGPARIPHILGVWLGHAIEMSHSASHLTIEDLGRKLREAGESTLKLLVETQERVRTLSATLEDITRGCADMTHLVGKSLSDLRSTATSTVAAANEFNRSISDTARATGQIAIVNKQLIELLDSALLRRDGAG